MNTVENRTTARADSSRFLRHPLDIRPAHFRPLRYRAAAGVAVGLSLASGGCSTGLTPPQAVSAALGLPACQVTGAAKVLARHVIVPGGIETSARDRGFLVRFMAAPSHCVAVYWPSQSVSPDPASCPAVGTQTARTDSADETMLAWESGEAREPHITLGVVAYDVPQAVFGFATEGRRYVVPRRFFAPAAPRGSGETSPELVPIGHDRFLLAWVEGDVQSHRLRAQAVLGWGEPFGAAIDLSLEEASVIGRPSLAVAPNGDGLVTYLASMNDEFDVFATPIACALNWTRLVSCN